MTPRQWRNGLKRVGESQEGFATLIESSPRQGQRWATEGCKSGPATILMKLMLKGYVTREQIEEVKK